MADPLSVTRPDESTPRHETAGTNGPHQGSAFSKKQKISFAVVLGLAVTFSGWVLQVYPLDAPIYKYIAYSAMTALWLLVPFFIPKVQTLLVEGFGGIGRGQQIGLGAVALPMVFVIALFWYKNAPDGREIIRDAVFGFSGAITATANEPTKPEQDTPLTMPAELVVAPPPTAGELQALRAEMDRMQRASEARDLARDARIKELERQLAASRRDAAVREEARRDAYEEATKSLLALIKGSPSGSCAHLGVEKTPSTPSEINLINMFPRFRAEGGGAIARLLATDHTESSSETQRTFDGWYNEVRNRIQNALGRIAENDFATAPPDETIIESLPDETRAKMTTGVSNRVRRGAAALRCFDQIEYNIRARIQ